MVGVHRLAQNNEPREKWMLGPPIFSSTRYCVIALLLDVSLLCFGGSLLLPDYEYELRQSPSVTALELHRLDRKIKK
jgi:hypothetical protein